jgi:hypothetical protein
MRDTGHADVNQFLDVVRDCVRSALDADFVGMYVGGSLALGAFDSASDIDVVIATAGDVSHRIAALDAVHRQLAGEPVWFAAQLECIYMPTVGMRRFDQSHAKHLKLDRGPGETLKIEIMDESWIVSSHVLRTHGITWDGPDPATLIDPISRQDLRIAMRGVLAGWATDLLRRPDALRAPGYQSYTVLSLCRILYTLDVGGVLAKADAAKWAIATLSSEWHDLITQAVVDRSRDHARPSDAAVARTLGFIEFARGWPGDI